MIELVVGVGVKRRGGGEKKEEKVRKSEKKREKERQREKKREKERQREVWENRCEMERRDENRGIIIIIIIIIIILFHLIS